MYVLGIQASSCNWSGIKFLRSSFIKGSVIQWSKPRLKRGRALYRLDLHRKIIWSNTSELRPTPDNKLMIWRAEERWPDHKPNKRTSPAEQQLLSDTRNHEIHTALAATENIEKPPLLCACNSDIVIRTLQRSGKYTYQLFNNERIEFYIHTMYDSQNKPRSFLWRALTGWSLHCAGECN